jgi:hypothetical protein
LILSKQEYAKIIGKGGQFIKQIVSLTNGVAVKAIEIDEETRLVCNIYTDPFVNFNSININLGISNWNAVSSFISI